MLAPRCIIGFPWVAGSEDLTLTRPEREEGDFSCLRRRVPGARGPTAGGTGHVKFGKILWFDSVEQKMLRKHRVEAAEVEEVLEGEALILLAQGGRISGEDLYVALGRTDSGRCLAVYFIRKRNRDVQVVTARDMTRKERRRYARSKA
jgi:uncharacterized DUF497 family protein